MTVASLFKDVMNSSLQSQSASRELDIVGMLDHWAGMIGIEADLTQFRRTPQQMLLMSMLESGQPIDEQVMLKLSGAIDNFQNITTGNKPAS